jgi:hypothetical protein
MEEYPHVSSWTLTVHVIIARGKEDCNYLSGAVLWGKLTSPQKKKGGQ